MKKKTAKVKVPAKLEPKPIPTSPFKWGGSKKSC